ncbi:MAG: aminopeptidase P family protein, partial [Candidatus Aminicenantes bacterium]|nr:aminopeptidase P family protein [Candidatus Aminicenantes bacterium]
FTGSAGDVVVTRTTAGLWTDSRYHLQAELELDSRTFTLFKLGAPGVPGWQEWLARELKKGSVVGIDPKLITHADFVRLEKILMDSGKRLKAVDQNLVDMLWKDRPDPSRRPVLPHPPRFAGETVASKLSRVRGKMKEAGVDFHILSRLDDIAWLFNFRGSDVSYNPVAVAYALVGRNVARLYINPAKTTPALASALKGRADLRPYEAFSGDLDRLARQRLRVWADDGSTSRWITLSLGKKTAWHFDPSPVGLFKAVKNAAEIRGAREAHLADGAALVRFLSWLDRTAGSGKVTELSAERNLLEFRAQNRFFRGPSFRTISAFGPHAAVVHYAADEKSDIPLGPRGLYLIDSGGQYRNATTDITRTVCLGRPRREEREAFSLVLKGLIALTTAAFPAGTAGRQLDVLARTALWERGMNYGHGTGHGVGAFLSVHEGPQAISPTRCRGTALEPGMITSIEPGFYREDRFGVRIENLALVVADESRSSADGKYMTFKTLSLCPIDIPALNLKLLTPREIAWLNAYHARVRKALTPLLDRVEAEWLTRATRRLQNPGL